MAILGIVGLGARAEPVPVCIQNDSVVPIHLLGRAQALANEIFADAGIEIQWHRCQASGDQSRVTRPIRIEMSTNTPKRRMIGVLAFALPDERITVFYDRVRMATQFELSPDALLGHVLVHEIAHVLEGKGGHSSGGVMKLRFSQQDIKAMRHGHLSFVSEDVQSIRAGLAERTDASKTVTIFLAGERGINEQ